MKIDNMLPVSGVDWKCNISDGIRDSAASKADADIRKSLAKKPIASADSDTPENAVKDYITETSHTKSAL